jgi:Circularly permutated YpsA SLOG family
MAASMRIITGGQTGVDRAALDIALERGIDYGGWCPKGGWAEDRPRPPGLLESYPKLEETPLADPAQRTKWNVRDADACMILIQNGAGVSKGTMLAQELAARMGKPLLVVDLDEPGTVSRANAWLRTQREAFGPGLRLAIGGPRESEASGIYRRAREFLGEVLAAF